MTDQADPHDGAETGSCRGAADAPVDDSSYLGAAQDCLDLWASAVPVACDADDQVLFNVAFPLVAHAMNQVATALLVGEQFPLVAAGAARVALEHAVAAQWVLLTAGGPEQLVRAMEHAFLTRAHAFSEALDHPPELAGLDATQSVDGRLRSWNIGNVMNRFATGGLFYDLYRELSGAVHPSYATLQAHTDIRTSHAVTRIDRHGAETRVDCVAQVLGLSAVLAMDTLERIRTPDSRLDQVQAIARAAGLPADLASGDTRPDLWPTG